MGLSWRDFIFSEKSGEQLVKLPGQIDGQAFRIEDLKDCVVLLLDHSAQVTIDCCENTKFLIGPCEDDVFIRNCTNCVFTVACRQLRTREVVDCRINLFVVTTPIVEMSSRVTFAPFNAEYEGLEGQFAAARLSGESNQYHDVYDFNKDDESIPMPHWEVVETSETWPVDVNSLSGSGGAPMVPAADASTKATEGEGGAVETEAAAAAADGVEANVFEGVTPSSREAVVPEATPTTPPAVPDTKTMADAIAAVDTSHTDHPLVVWRRGFESRLDKLREESQRKLAQQREEGKTFISKFEKERTDRIAKNKKANREAETVLIETLNPTPSGNPWETICALVDFRDRGANKSSPVKKAKRGSTGAASAPASASASASVSAPADKSRMRSCMLAAKNMSRV